MYKQHSLSPRKGCIIILVWMRIGNIFVVLQLIISKGWLWPYRDHQGPILRLAIKPEWFWFYHEIQHLLKLYNSNLLYNFVAKTHLEVLFQFHCRKELSGLRPGKLGISCVVLENLWLSLNCVCVVWNFPLCSIIAFFNS